MPAFSHKPLPERRSSDGFTLTETLVVIALIAGLAAILFPVFSKMKNKAEAVESATKLRQLGIAAVSYSGDNQNILPPATGSDHWTEVLAPYAGVTFKPGDASLQPDLYRTKAGYRTLSDTDKKGFAVNFSLNQMSSSPEENSYTHWGKYNSLRTLRIPEPGAFRLFGDRAGEWRGWQGIYELNLIGFHFNDRANFCFLDGHVEAVSRSEMENFSRFQWTGGSKANSAALGFNADGM